MVCDYFKEKKAAAAAAALAFVGNFSGLASAVSIKSGRYLSRVLFEGPRNWQFLYRGKNMFALIGQLVRRFFTTNWLEKKNY